VWAGDIWARLGLDITGDTPMRLPSEFEQLFAADFDSPPFELATHVDRDNAFLSCYLDTRAGKKAAIEFLDRKAGHVRDTLRGVERFHFDRGSARIRAAIEENWVGEMQGMAVFSPGSEPTRNPIVVHSETPFDNRLVSFAVPELLPLVAQQQREPRFDLIWLRAGESGAPRSRYLEDIGGIQTSSRFGSESLTTLGGADLAGAIHQFKRPGSRPVGVAPRASWDCLSRPLLVAITPEVLPCVADLMPDWAADRLVGSIEVSAADSLEDVVGMARLVGHADNSVTLSRGTSVVGKAQSAGNGRPFPRAVTQPTTLVPRPFGSRCASATLRCVSCQGKNHCLQNAS
jgi:hypothetical protein